MCRVLKVSRSSYYKWLRDPEGVRGRKRKELDKKIQTAYFAAYGRHGSPRLTKDIQKAGTSVSRLTVVLDLFDRKPIGWSISDGMSASKTVIPAILMASRSRSFKKGMIFHSDRGVQYASTNTVNVLKSFGIERSMSRKVNCRDNAVAESFFKSFKSELIYGSKLKSKEETSLYIFEYIESWYNKKRRHSALGNLTVEEFWQQYEMSKDLMMNVA